MDFKGRNKISPEFNMSSMTDIVFLLLIFFMLASTLVTTNAIDLLLPKSSSKTTQSRSVTVSITENLEYYVDNVNVQKDRLEAEILRKTNDVESPQIVMRVHEDVDIKHAVFIMDITNRNRIKSTLAVRQD